MNNCVLKKFKNVNMYLIKNDKGISGNLKKGQKAYDKRELAFMNILRKNIKKNDICMDIGANIGFVTLQMAMIVGAKGFVFALEPDPINVKILKKNKYLNNFENIIQIDQVAISDRIGNQIFYTSDKSNLGSLNKTNNCLRKKILVKTNTLDSFLANKKELPVFYKMDVEGHEANILNGMKNTAIRSKQGTKILIEVHPQFYNKNINMEEALRKMNRWGFKIKYVISAGVPIPDLFKIKGYKPFIQYKNFSRAIYNNISTEDAIYFSSKCHKQYIPAKKKYSNKIVRSIMMEKV